MLSRTWRDYLEGVALNVIRYLVLCIALFPIWPLFGVSVSEPALWQKMLWDVLFPLASLPWPESTGSIIICLLLNAILWGNAVQLLIQLRSIRHLQN
jgi:hypothetical protein